ncbi:MAG: hypothetical protein ACK5RL_14830 [Acidimicrobiales bacterium]
MTAVAAPPADRRGLVLPVVAVMSALTLVAAALAVDIGRADDARNELQAVSALAAIDAARVVDGRPAGAVRSTVEDAALASAARNGYGTERDELAVDLGALDPAGGFEVVGPKDVPTAVRVTVERRLDYLFMPGGRTIGWSSLAGDSGGLAGIELGMFAAAVTGPNVPSLNALLGALLGGPVDLDLTAYRHLARASVTPAELQVVASAASLDALLALTVPPSELLGLVAAAMVARGDGDALAAVEPLSALQGATTTPDAVSVGRVLGITPGAAAPWAHAEIAVGDLVRNVANEAGRGKVLTLDVPVEAPGVESATVRAVVVDGGRQAFGGAGTFVEGSQLRLYLELGLGDVAGGPLQVPVSFDLARPSATIESVSCEPDGTGRAVSATVDPSLAQLTVGSLTDAELRAGDPPSPATVLETPGVGRIIASGGTTVDTAYRTVVLPAPFGLGRRTRITGGDGRSSLPVGGLELSPEPLAGSGTDLDADALVRARIEDALAGLPPVIDRLVAAAGLLTGGADIAVIGVVCGVPHLIPHDVP